MGPGTMLAAQNHHGQALRESGQCLSRHCDAPTVRSALLDQSWGQGSRCPKGTGTCSVQSDLRWREGAPRWDLRWSDRPSARPPASSRPSPSGHRPLPPQTGLFWTHSARDTLSPLVCSSAPAPCALSRPAAELISVLNNFCPINVSTWLSITCW